MKGFKSTGKGPHYGNFNFSSRSGFADSSGKTRTVGSYTRKVAKKARGGAIANAMRQAMQSQFSEGEANTVDRANAVGSSMTPLEAASMARKSPVARARPAAIVGRAPKAAFSRMPKIGK